MWPYGEWLPVNLAAWLPGCEAGEAAVQVALCTADTAKEEQRSPGHGTHT